MDLTKLQREYDQIKKDAETLDRNIRDTVVDLTRSEQRVSTKQKELEKLQREHDSLKLKHDEFEKRRNDYQINMEKMHREIEDMMQKEWKRAA